MKNIISMEKLLEKVKKIKESGSFDLSMEEDLSIAIMNLVSLEEHFYFTAEKTGKNEYFDLLAEVREIRKKLLAKITSLKINSISMAKLCLLKIDKKI